MDNDGKNVIDVVLELPFHYIDNILDFLGVFMPLTNAKLSSSIIKRLWTGKTHEKMCKWVAYSGREDMFEDECQKYIIKHLICQEKCVASISRNEFDCLCQIFFILNDRYRRLSRNKNDVAKSILITSNFCMVQSIWQCAVYANDERVSDDATRILISTCNEDNWDSHLQSVCFLSEKELDVKTLPEVKIECGKNSNIELTTDSLKLDNCDVSQENDKIVMQNTNKSQLFATKEVLYRDPWRVYVEYCCAYLSKKDVRADVAKVKRCFRLLEGVLENSERFGLKSLRSHIHRSRGRPVKSCIRYKSEKFYLEGFANDTLWAMRKAIALHLKLSPHDFDLYMIRNDVKISFQENDNSKTLFQNNFRKSENVFVESKPWSNKSNAIPVGAAPYVEDHARPIARRKNALLTLLDDRPTPRFEQIIYQIFEQHSKDGKMMSRDEIIAYFIFCGASGASLDDTRIGDIISKFDFSTNSSGDLCMTRKGFLCFYVEAASSRPASVWKDLKRHGYNDNLTRLVRQGRIDEAIVCSEPIKIEGNASAAHKRDGALEHDEKYVEGRNERVDDAMAHRLLQRSAKHLPRHWLVHKKNTGMFYLNSYTTMSMK